MKLILTILFATVLTSVAQALTWEPVTIAQPSVVNTWMKLVELPNNGERVFSGALMPMSEAVADVFYSLNADLTYNCMVKSYDVMSLGNARQIPVYAIKNCKAE